MTEHPLGELTPGQFLDEYWQRKPLLVRQAFPGFEPPLDGDDLAGLACEEFTEARLVSGSVVSGEWRLSHGPFAAADFEQLGERDWTLLVQDVEKHYPPLQDIMARFDFLPSWRLDDLMVSFAAQGGSVGPHVDQYDVFLLQAQGRRHWQIATRFDPARVPNCALDVLAGFQAEEEWTLEAGDMLYLPPGVAHHGVALDPCLTYSIGLRAPSAADLAMALGERLAAHADEGGRYADPGLQPAARTGEVDRAALDGLRRLLADPLTDRDATDALVGDFLSRYRMAHEPAPPPEAPVAEEVFAALSAGVGLQRNPWTRLVWIESAGRARLFAAGTAFDCSIAMAVAICGPEPITADAGRLDEESRATLLELVNRGHLFLPL